MYIILVYDISMEDKEGSRVLRNVFKICKKYLIHIQNSTFEGEISESQILKLNKEINKYIRKQIDSVIIFKARSLIWMEKEFWGKVEADKTENFI